MKIMKFGGTSVGTPQRMQHIATILKMQKDKAIVVLSAIAGTTNTLVEIGIKLANNDVQSAKTIINRLEEKYYKFASSLIGKKGDIKKVNFIIREHFEFLRSNPKNTYSDCTGREILAQGELLSTKLFSAYLEEIGLSHKLLPALDFMSIDDSKEPEVAHIQKKLSAILDSDKEYPIYITQGFICTNHKNEIDNLRRGGSDFTASLIAAVVKATACEIWTDIDGMHNNDPRLVENTRQVEHLSFDEAAELAYFGAKILHPSSIGPAQQFNIPVKLLNTMDTKAKGTLITKEAKKAGVKAVAAKDNITVIHIKSSRMLLAYGFLRKVFEVFEKYRTAIDMITTSEVAISLTIDDDSFLENIVTDLEPFCTVQYEKNQTIVAVVGHEIAKTDDIIRKLLISIKNISLRMVSYGGSPHNISFLISSKDKRKMLQDVNKGMFGL